jgi:hypothetical protein
VVPFAADWNKCPVYEQVTGVRGFSGSTMAPEDLQVGVYRPTCDYKELHPSPILTGAMQLSLVCTYCFYPHLG